MIAIPLFAPFALLCCVCALWPRPSWTRRVDWWFTGFWVGYFCLYAGFVFAMYEVAS